MSVFYRCKAVCSVIVDGIVGFLRDRTAPLRNRISDTESQKKLILIIVSVALLLDNMLYMVIVPIVTELFESSERENTTSSLHPQTAKNLSFESHPTMDPNIAMSTQSEPQIDEGLVGILFASKAIVQLLANPFTGTYIDRVGYVLPLTLGLMVMFTSTTLFAFAKSYAFLFLARSMQGLGSALADTAALGLIADRFHDEKERSKALGIALAFISFGSLVAPPLGGFLFEYVGREYPFLLLAFICLIDSFLLLLVQIPASDENRAKDGNIPVGTPIYKLFMDPYIIVIALALMLANFPLAFLEPTIARWMKNTMNADNFEIGLVWLPAFIPHVIGVYVTVRLTEKYFRYQWLYGALGLVLIGVSTVAVPTCKSFVVLMIPLAILCFGIALIDTALLPTLAFLVDVRHTSVYGSVYAIADISYSIAYALGPILAGQTVKALGYLKMNVGIGIINMMFAPLLLFLREVYDWKQDKTERVNLLDTDTGLSVPPSVSEGGGKIDGEKSDGVESQHHEQGQETLEDKEPNYNHLNDSETNAKAKNGYLKHESTATWNKENPNSFTKTSVKPRPRPGTKKVEGQAVFKSTSFTEKGNYEAENSNDGVYWGKQASGEVPNSLQTSLSKQELRSLAESGVEFYNPLFENSEEIANSKILHN